MLQCLASGYNSQMLKKTDYKQAKEKKKENKKNHINQASSGNIWNDKTIIEV